MKAAAFLALVPGVLCLAAFAQDPHAAHKHSPPATPTQSTPAPATSDDPHADHEQPPPAPGHPSVPANGPHARHATPMASGAFVGQPASAASLPVGDDLPPPVIKDNVSDTFFPVASMTRARDILNNEHGRGLTSKWMANLLEGTTGSGDEGYRWNIEGRYGGDLHRFEFKSEGEAPSGEVESAEVQGLYSRAVGRYTAVQAGMRYDFEPRGLAYATVGVESLLPYWFGVEGALFLSERGDAFARLEGSYDLRFTQRLILQPRVELTLAAQEVSESNIGAGFSVAEIGLRLRYDIRREFAPYIGVNFETSLGQTADFVRASGGDVDDTSFVVGLRAWF